jgi:hypothetical protein
MQFQYILLLLGKIEARWCVEFTGVEHAGGAEIATPVEKVAAGPVEKTAACLHTMWAERELCAG